MSDTSSEAVDLGALRHQLLCTLCSHPVEDVGGLRHASDGASDDFLHNASREPLDATSPGHGRVLLRTIADTTPAEAPARCNHCGQRLAATVRPVAEMTTRLTDFRTNVAVAVACPCGSAAAMMELMSLGAYTATLDTLIADLGDLVQYEALPMVEPEPWPDDDEGDGQ